jgi:hypothetical protein
MEIAGQGNPPSWMMRVLDSVVNPVYDLKTQSGSSLTIEPAADHHISKPLQ